MSPKRRVGQTRATSHGVDHLAGAHPGTQAAAHVGARDEAGDLAAAVPDLDQRERRQSPRRKAAGPTKAPTKAARPTAPPPDSPPPTDPA
jgi:hypothetical protein